MKFKTLLENELTDVQKNYRKIMAQNELEAKDKETAEKYETPKQAWEKFSNFEIDYDELEDVLVYFNKTGKLSNEELERYQEKAGELEDKGTDKFEKEFKPKPTFKDKVRSKIKKLKG